MSDRRPFPSRCDNAILPRCKRQAMDESSSESSSESSLDTRADAALWVIATNLNALVAKHTAKDPEVDFHGFMAFCFVYVSGADMSKLEVMWESAVEGLGVEGNAMPLSVALTWAALPKVKKLMKSA